MLRDGDAEVVMQDVIHMRIEGETVWLDRFFEDPAPVRARLVEADFLKHTLTLVPLVEQED